MPSLARRIRYLSHSNSETYEMVRMFVVALLLISCRSFGQQPDSLDVDSLVVPIEHESSGSDNLFDQFLTESDDLQLLDDLAWRKDHPFDLNTISKEELQSLPGITPFEADRFIEFRSGVRRFTAVRQLRVIQDVGEDLYDKLSPYVIVMNESREGTLQLRSRTSRDLQPRRGTLDSTFIGSSFKSYNRVSIGAGDLQAGALFEKDGGERFSNSFVSGYAAINDIGPFSRVVAGDFNVDAGQGLVLWRGSAFGKGGDGVSAVKKSGTGAQPYRSTDEFNFFRGVAANASVDFEAGRLDVTAFFSRRLLDASADTIEGVTSFYEEGLFRTTNELQKQRAVTEQLAGGRVQFTSVDGWSVGSTAYRSTFDKPIASDRIYEFTGSTQQVFGVDAAVSMGRVSAFGEVARSGDGAVAGIAGTILNIGRKSNVALVYRDYGPAFNNFHASGFGEHSDTKNERGFYFGLDIQALRWLKFSGYVDQFRFPWRTFSNPLPATGHEILAQAEADVAPKVDLALRFTHKSTEGTESEIDPFGRDTRPIIDRSQQKYRMTVSYKATPRVTVKGRLEFTGVNYDVLGRKERGYLLFQDFRYSASKAFSIEGRLIFFHTDSYDSRLYEYENDLRGVFSNPALYGIGRRWYMMVRCNVANILTLSAKYSETQKEGVTSMGSGVTEILGDVDNRLALQVDVGL